MNIAHKTNIVIVILCNSLNPADKAKVESIPVISKFRPKSMGREAQFKIIGTRFPETIYEAIYEIYYKKKPQRIRTLRFFVVIESLSLIKV